MDEKDIGRETAAYYQARAQEVIKNLKKRRINGLYVASESEALAAVMEMIPPGAVVARGDSISLDQIDLVPAIKKRNQNALIDPFEINNEGLYILPMQEREQMMRESFLADILITGSNAVTLDGKLVNIDGVGNRVAAMIYGPAKVILVVGINKVVKDVHEALDRIHNYAAPINAQRHYMKHKVEIFKDLPCVLTGRCMDCRHDAKICNNIVIIEGAIQRRDGRINVVLVGKELGI